MKTLLFSALLLLPVAAFSQKKETTVTYVKATNSAVNFHLEIPDYMESTTSLDEGRPFQYMNTSREQYIIASFEDLQTITDLLNAYGTEGKTLLEKYVNHNWEILQENVKMISRQPVEWTTISGMSACIYQFDGTVAGVAVPINYYVAFIQGKTQMYFIMIWTLRSLKKEFRPVADKMLHSFSLK